MEPFEIKAMNRVAKTTAPKPLRCFGHGFSRPSMITWYRWGGRQQYE